jgi:hypothetical protein
VESRHLIDHATGSSQASPEKELSWLLTSSAIIKPPRDSDGEVKDRGELVVTIANDELRALPERCRVAELRR